MSRTGDFTKVITVIFICLLIYENILLFNKSSVIGTHTLWIFGVCCLDRVTYFWWRTFLNMRTVSKGAR